MRVKRVQYWLQGKRNLEFYYFEASQYSTCFRGAELIEGLRRKQVKLQIQREEEILLKIKQKMDRIKANQQKFQPAITVERHDLGMYFGLSLFFLISFLRSMIFLQLIAARNFKFVRQCRPKQFLFFV